MDRPRAERHYGMDWLRIGAFVLLILYHVGFSFTPWGFQTPTRGVVGWAEIPLLGLNAWRLPLLFAISGYASAALLERERSPGAFLKSRMLRLGLPLLFGLTVIVPPQPYMGVLNTGYAHGYGYFLLHDAFQFHRVMGENLPAVMHLWFVIYLLAYSVALCLALMALPVRWRSALARGAEKMLAGRALLPVGCLLVYAVRAPGDGWTDTHSLFTDFAAHLHYGGMFLFGFALRGSGALRQAIVRQWKPALLIGLAGYAFVFLETWYFPGNARTPRAWTEPLDFAKAVQCWGMVIALFGIADRYWNHDAKWRATLAEAVFPVFIAHQTVMVLASYWLRDKGLTAGPEFVLLCLSVAAGSWLFYLVGREIGPLRPLIGLKKAKPGKRPGEDAVLASSTV